MKGSSTARLTSTRGVTCALDMGGYGGGWCLVVEVLARPLGSGVVGRAAVVWDALFFCGISLLVMLLEYDTILHFRP